MSILAPALILATTQECSRCGKKVCRFAGANDGLADRLLGIRGELAGIDPEAWKIADGRLYLNFNKEIQSDWLKDIPGYNAKADQNWPALAASRAAE